MVVPVIEPGRCDPLFSNNGLTNACISQISTISFSPISTIQIQSVSCTDFIYCQTISITPITPPGPTTTQDICTVGNCLTIPSDVPIKQLLSGTMISPWVRIRFPQGVTDGPEFDYTEITTGNISQPGVTPPCRASIKSFQYGWGSINSGNICKVQIVDESGSSFSDWFKRIAQRPQKASSNSGQGVYRMKVTFGWLVTDGCPGQVTGAGCVSPTSTGSCCNDFPPNYSSNPTQLVCSPALWFLPNNITVNLQNGKFIYEIEGIDLLFRAAEQPSQLSYGEEPLIGVPPKPARTHFRDAVQRLAAQSIPPFLVDFKQLNENTGASECLQFFVSPNTAIVPHEHIDSRDGTISLQCQGVNGAPCTQASNDSDLATRGPLGVWACKGLNPLAAIQSWMTNGGVTGSTQNPVLARSGKGLTMNYDPTYTRTGVGTDCADPVVPAPATAPAPPIHGRLIIWLDSYPNYSNQTNNYIGRTKALYVVNGGKASPVFSFTPNIKWNWNAAARAGGVTGPASGEQTSNNIENAFLNTPGVGPRNETVTANNLLNQGQGGPRAAVTQAVHKQANLLTYSIEAELRVQGDPSDWLCTPLKGYGRTIALVVINPFYLDNPDNNCPVWSTLTRTACNEILTNPNWFIKGVDHQIKEGSYVTTYKLILFVPSSELSGKDANGKVMNLGGASFVGTTIPDQTFLCQQATWTCDGWTVVGDDPLLIDGTNSFCNQVCGSDFVVT